MNFPPLRYIFVMSVPYIAAMSSLSGLNIMGLQYTGFVWAGVLYLGFLLILQHRGSIPFQWKIWLPWFGYVFLSIAWGGFHVRYNLQFPLQMITPLIVGIVSSFSILKETQFIQLNRGFLYAFLFIATVFVYFFYGPGAQYQRFGFGYSVRPSAMLCCIIGCLCVAGTPRNGFLGVLGWAACLTITVFSS